ncbi:MAG: DUF6129 family protein [Pseudomonadota bacterium]|nr:DUF6129 family protein [Pseudomonadota bacterium]
MIDSATLDRVARFTLGRGLDETTVQALRAAWPDLHFSYCADDDVCGPRPVRALAGINIYLVDGRGHCLQFTDQPELATGLVLAEVEADDADD